MTTLDYDIAPLFPWHSFDLPHPLDVKPCRRGWGGSRLTSENVVSNHSAHFVPSQL
jgi:hypothetical protein